MNATDNFVERINIDDHLPEGNYVCEVRTFSFKRIGEQPQIHWNLEIIEGEFKGATIKKVSNLSSPEGKAYLRKELQQNMKIELPEEGQASPSEIQPLVLGLKVIVHRTNYNNYWQALINGLAKDKEEEFRF